MEKIALPIKTKIAAWWMVAVGLIFSVVSFWVNMDWSAFKYYNYLMKEGYFSSMVEMYGSLLRDHFPLYFPSFISLVFLFFPGVLLLSKKRWAWKFAAVSLTLGGLLEIMDIIWALSEHLPYYAFPRFRTSQWLLLLLLIPFFLLIYDKEPFQKIE